MAAACLEALLMLGLAPREQEGTVPPSQSYHHTLPWQVHLGVPKT